MELVQRQPARRRVHEVHEGEADSRARRPEVLPREPVHGQCSERDRDRLDDEQHLGARPDPPERGEEHEDRVDVRPEPRDLVTVEVSHTQRVAVRRRPDCLHHIPEVEAAGRESILAQHRERCEPGGIRCNPGDEELARRGKPEAAHSARSMMPRHRGPSTASLARPS